MKIFINFSPLILISLLVFSISCDNDDDPKPNNCIEGDHNRVTRTIDLPEDITGFTMSIVAEVILTKGSEQEIVIEAEQNIIDNIETDVSDKSWIIEYDQCVDDHEDIIIYMTLPTLENIVVTGVGQISSTNTFDELDDLLIVFVGAGTIDLAIEANSVACDLTGTGDIVLSGTTIEQNITLTGAGNYKAFGLASDICNINLTGVGNCEVSVSDELTGTISGVGSIFYKGTPAINITITGTGSLIDAN